MKKAIECTGLRVEGQKMEVLGRLTSSVIHDLNNLLTVIGLNAALIESGGMSAEEVTSAAGKIVEASRHSAELTRKVLNFARPSAGELEDMQVDEVVEGMLRMLSPLMARKVSVRTELKCSEWLRADRSEIELAVMNLVLNAVEAMPGGGEIVITTGGAGAPCCTQEGMACICVRDQGEGVATGLGETIFEPFFTTKQSGTGLGLSIVDHVVRHHGGSVEFMSPPEGGTIFKMFLPVSQGPVDDEAEEESLLSDRRPSGVVLLVEDDPAIRELTRQLLSRHFVRVIDVATAEEGWEIWEREREAIDLLFTDIVLPGEMSGRDLAVKIHKQSPDLPVLYMSGFGGSGEDRSFLTESNFLPKPFPAEALRSAVERVLAGAA